MFVGLLVRYARCDFSKSISLIFVKLAHMFSTRVDFTVNFSKIKVKDQGQSSRSKFKVKTAVLKIFNLQ